MKVTLETSAPLWWRRFLWRMTPARFMAGVMLFLVLTMVLLPMVALLHR